MTPRASDRATFVLQILLVVFLVEGVLVEGVLVEGVLVEGVLVEGLLAGCLSVFAQAGGLIAGPGPPPAFVCCSGAGGRRLYSQNVF